LLALAGIVAAGPRVAWCGDATGAEGAAAEGEAKPESKGLEIGSPAPDFTLPDLDGKMVSLSERLKSGPVLLDFWALWCKPCLKSLPATEKIKTDYAARGLSVLAINTDSPRSAPNVKPYVKTNRFTFDVLLDPNSTLQRSYRFYRIPQLFLIAQDGTIAYSHLGYVPGGEKDVIAAIDKLLGAAPPGAKGE